MIRTLFLICLLSCCISLSAQGVVVQQIDAITEEMNNQGYRAYDQPKYLNLEEGESYDYEIRLEASQRYNIWGVCDGDCEDLDLRLLDAYGNVIDEDLLEDDVPVIDPVAPQTGMYTLRVIMHDCEIAPCKIGIGFFSQSADNPVTELEEEDDGVMVTGDTPQELVDNQLLLLEETMEENDLRRFRNNEYLWLDEEETQTLEVELTAGTIYQIWGVCDGDCGDLDMELQDVYGNQIDEDILDDAQPLIDETVGQSGTYRLLVKMYDCSVEPCLVGINFFAQ
ncbi:MAG: hypothetical protein AAF433_08550 [Bacteroidota bacterium]